MLNILITNLSQVRTIWSAFLATLVLTLSFEVPRNLDHVNFDLRI
jgi:hypothetical protein